MELLGVVTVSDRKSNSAGELVHSLTAAEVILRATSGGLVCGVTGEFRHLEMCYLGKIGGICGMG